MQGARQLGTLLLGAALLLDFNSAALAGQTGNTKSWKDVEPQPKFLAAVYGMADCVNVPPAETVLPDKKNSLQTKCNVVEDPDTPGSYITSAASFPNNPIAQQQLPAWLRQDRTENFYLDALPVSLSLPFESDHPGHEFFVITTNKGRNATSLLSNAVPANEPNELNSIALAGHFGDGVTGSEWPVKVTIVGDVFLKDYFTGERINANGMTARVEDFPDMRYMNANAAPHLVQAIIEPLDSGVMAGESSTNMPLRPGVYPNHCRAIWGNDVTHRIRVMLSGGATLNGVTQVLATDEVFKVLKKSGEALTFGANEVFMGLADLGNSKTKRIADTDNYFDLCLKDPTKAIVSDVGKVQMPCNAIKLYYPRGTGVSVNDGKVIWNGCQDGSIDVIHSPKMNGSTFTAGSSTQAPGTSSSAASTSTAGSSTQAPGTSSSAASISKRMFLGLGALCLLRSLRD
eukprot:CAMPEP_0172777538 /NCGR_PEP_ID=MMETSP1074-20121228/201446_1 /TAXON_ID=2916 /ORGANISM="Ceratium fusus, Strain PA161109" /LENGTH=457 /DNA_ID=CAMNT_0013614457 /DNA_START=105 /DNA_END=1478 /DNA_ORIENTATION=-